MVEADELTPEQTNSSLFLISMLATKVELKKSTQNVTNQLFIKSSKNTLSKAELIKGLKIILHDIEDATGFILKPQFEEVRRRYY